LSENGPIFHIGNQGEAGTAGANSFRMENIVLRPTIPANHCVSMRGRITRIESDRGNLFIKGFSEEERWRVETGTPVYRCNRMVSVRDLLPGDIVTVLGYYSNHRLHVRSIRLHFLY
jgi:hypothetical protein